MRFYKERWNRKLGGVLGGLGRLLKVDPNVLRILFVFFTIVTGFLLMPLLYLIAFLLMPTAPRGPYIVYPHKTLYRSTKNKILGGVCSGIAAFCKLKEPWIIRAVLILLGLFSSGLLFIPIGIAYVYAASILPER